MDNPEPFRSSAEIIERQTLKAVLVLSTEELKDPKVKELLDGVSGIYSWSIAPKRDYYEEYAKGFSLRDRDKSLQAVDKSTGTAYTVKIEKSNQEYDRFEGVNDRMQEEENRKIFSSIFKRVCGPVYIGESKDLGRRLLEHRRTIIELTKDFDWNPDDDDAAVNNDEINEEGGIQSENEDSPKIQDFSFLKRISQYLKSSSTLYDESMIREEWFFVQIFPFQNQNLVTARRKEIEEALITLIQPIGNKKSK